MYDLIVIGGGSAGLASAKEAINYKKKVLLISKEELGGTCVNMGCVPKKMCYNLAYIISLLEVGKSYGVKSSYSVDWPSFVKKRTAYIKKLNAFYQDQIKRLGIDFVHGSATLDDEGKVIVDGKFYTAKKVILATGSKAKTLKIPGKEYLNYSDDFFNLEEIPRRTMIIGSGYIAVELAFVLKKLGSDVTMSIRGENVLRKFDQMIGEHVHRNLLSAGVKIITNSTVQSVEKVGNEFVCNVETQDENRNEGVLKNCSDFIICAIGRDCPMSFISKKVFRKDGFIPVDKDFQTTLPGVYALGDLIGPRNMLTPYAIFCGRRLVRSFYGNLSLGDTEEFVPSVVFSHPPAATVGLTEEEAIKTYGEIEKYESRFINLFFALTDFKENSHVKIIAVKKKVVGIHYIGMGADEAIQGFTTAIKKGLTIDELKNTVCVHPTGSEEVITVKSVF